jgi:hypothetical protein
VLIFTRVRCDRFYTERATRTDDSQCYLTTICHQQPVHSALPQSLKWTSDDGEDWLVKLNRRVVGNQDRLDRS